MSPFRLAFVRARRLAGVATLLFLTLPAAAQLTVHVVDAASGPGSSFTTIAAAVAAASDGDVLLIRTGYYGAPLVLDGKGLVLQAEAGAHAQVVQLTVQNLAATQHALVRGLEFFQASGTAITLSSDAGPVWIEDAAYVSGFQPATTVLSVESCASVVVRNADFFGGTFYDSSHPPCVSIADSTAAFYDSALEGGTGDTVGDTALVVSDSTVTLYGTTVLGGVGYGSFGSSGIGGTGLLMTGTLGTTLVERVGGSIRGGAGKTETGGPGSPGTAVATSGSGGTLTVLPHIAHGYTSPSPIRSGAATSLSFSGDPGDLVFVAVAPAPALLTPTLRGIGPLTLAPTSQLIAFGALPMTTSSPSTLDVPVTAPPVLGTYSIYTQAIFLAPKTSPVGAHVALGSPTQICVLDASL